MQICEFEKNKHMPRLRECVIALQDYEHELDPRLPTGAEIVADYMPRMFFRCRHCDGKILIAEIDDEMAGYAMVLTKVTSDELEDGDFEYGLIADLMVLQEFRGQGVGRKLLDAAEAYARDRGVRWLRIGVLAKNAAAEGLYAKAGFSKIYVEREKQLTDESKKLP
jgi:GNAT superfamily N-acetyltransferase